MPVVISRDSDLGKELAKWDTPRNQYVLDSSGERVKDAAGNYMMGMGAIGIEPYPKMLYKAQRLPSGKLSVGEVPPHPAYITSPDEFNRMSNFVESFNRSCQCIVRSEDEELIKKGQGWCVTMPEALEQADREEQAIANAAAEAAYAARALSEKARAEVDAADAATSQHVTDVVGIPKSVRGSSDKAKGVTARPHED